MWIHYAALASQYDVAARFAAQAGYVPLSGNLMHHAIELQLKWGLIKAGVVPRGCRLSISARIWFTVQRTAAKCGVMRMPPESTDSYLRKK